MTDVKGADIRQLLEKICAMRKAQADYSFQQKIVVLIINLLFSTSFPTKPPRIVEKLQCCCSIKSLHLLMVIAKLFHVLSNSLFNSIRYWLTQGFRWPLLISSSALHPKRSHILHFCHFWALGASLEASFAKSICPAIIAYSSRNYDPGEIIILMVFARTNE